MATSMNNRKQELQAKRKQQAEKDVEEYATEEDEGSTYSEEDDDDDLPSRSESSSRVGSNAEAEEEEDEGEEGYRIGGYHRVAVNDVLGGKWRVEKKLGWGHFSTVWLVRNLEGTPAALKVQKSAPHYTEAAKDEIKILKACQNANDTEFSGKRFVVRLFDSFSHTGPNGNHMVMVFEVLGDNLLSLVEYYEYKGLPLRLVKQITWQVCAGLDFLHRQAQVIHCDLKLENILIAGLSTNFARTIADGMPCVATLRLDATSPVDSNGMPATPFSSEMLARKEETLKNKIKALETTLESLKGAERRQVKKKIERLQEQMSALQAERTQRTEFTLKASGRKVPAIDTMEDDDEGAGWQVVHRSGSNRSLSAPTFLVSAQPVKLISKAEMNTIADELWRRNLEFAFFPCIVPPATGSAARRGSISSPRASSRPSTPRSSRAGTPRSSSRPSTPLGPKSRKSPSPSASSAPSSPVTLIRVLSLEEKIKKEVKIAVLIISMDHLDKLIQKDTIASGEKTSPSEYLLKLTLGDHDSDQTFTCKIEEIGGGAEVETSIIRETIKAGQRSELGVAHRSESTKKNKAERKAKDSALAKLWSISCLIDFKMVCLQRIEEALSVTFLFSSKPLATCAESTIVGLPNQIAFVSMDTRARPIQARTEQLPPPLPKFVGSDLGITTPVDITVKIVDLGNSCWTFKHFSDDIQTRQYRAPEVILNAGYDCSADIWSLGCIVFELITGDLLFDPASGKEYSRDEDHLALITELMGPAPLTTLKGTRAKHYYDKHGKLLNVSDLYYSSLHKLLETTYKLEPSTSQKIAAFLNPCFAWEPKKRVTAAGCMKHPFISGFVG